VIPTATFANSATTIPYSVAAKTSQTTLTPFRSLTCDASGACYLRSARVTVIGFGIAFHHGGRGNRTRAAQQRLEEGPPAGAPGQSFGQFVEPLSIHSECSPSSIHQCPLQCQNCTSTHTYATSRPLKS
jgi:hypothetical protein